MNEKAMACDVSFWVELVKWLCFDGQVSVNGTDGNVDGW